MGCTDYREHYRLDGEVFHFEDEIDPPHREANRRLGQEMFRLARLKGDETVLDVGCGSGWLLAELRRSVKGPLFGVDLSRAQFLKGKGGSQSGSAFVEGDTYYLPFQTGSLDAVFMTEILEHLGRPDEAIRDVARVLKPGGKLLVSVPWKEKVRYTLCVHCNKKTPVNAHLHSFDTTRVRQILRNAGLHVVMLTSILNKILILSRAHLLLRFLPASIWRIIDRAAGLLLSRWTNICVRADKPF